MAITAADVNKLRQETGAGMMDCKKALTEADGDFEKAKESFSLAAQSGLAEGFYLFYRLAVVAKYRYVLRGEYGPYDKVKEEFPYFKAFVEEMRQYKGKDIESLYVSLRRVVWIYELRDIIGFNMKISDNASELLKKITPEDDEECQLALAKIFALQDVIYEVHYASFKKHSHQRSVGSVGNTSINIGFSNYVTATYKIRIINKSNLLLKSSDFWADPQSDKVRQAKNKMVSDGDGRQVCSQGVVEFKIGTRDKASQKINNFKPELHSFDSGNFSFINIQLHYKVRMKNFKELTFMERIFGAK